MGAGQYSSFTTIDFGRPNPSVIFNEYVIFNGGKPGAGAFRRINGLSVSGPDAAFFNANPNGILFPFNVAGGTYFRFPIRFDGVALRIYTATLTISYTPSGTSLTLFATFPLTVTVIANTTESGVFDTPNLSFPAIGIGDTETFPDDIVIRNISTVPIQIVTLAFTSGLSFAMVGGGPALPIVLAPGAASVPIQVSFTPTAAGSISDSLIATLDSAATTPLLLNGTGNQITPAFNLSGKTSGTLFGFPGEIRQADPANLDTEEVCSFTKMHDFGIIINEKQVLRVNGHYQDLGEATITIRAETRRKGQPNSVETADVVIGTVGATDEWVRSFYGEINITGELIQLQVSRAPGSGPVSIIDYTPELETKGEVVAGT